MGWEQTVVQISAELLTVRATRYLSVLVLRCSVAVRRRTVGGADADEEHLSLPGLNLWSHNTLRQGAVATCIYHSITYNYH